MVKALVDEAVAAGCPAGAQIDCSSAEEVWKPELRDAAQRARSAPVTSALSGEHGRRVGVVYNVDAAGKGSGASRSTGAASDSFIKSCVEISPYCWWILTSSGGVGRGLSSGTWKISAVPKPFAGGAAAEPPRRAPTTCPAEVLRTEVRDMVRRGGLPDAAGGRAAAGDTARARKAIDSLLSGGFADADILRVALEGFLSSLSTGDQKRAAVEVFAKYGCALARCRRAVWKGCVMEMCLLEALIAAAESSSPSPHANSSARSSLESASDQPSHAAAASDGNS
jgi:hypothetical protein